MSRMRPRRSRRSPWRGSAAARRSPSPACGAEWEFEPPSEDPFVRQELAETLYHVLWELVHVFFEHRGLLEGREAAQSTTPAASSFLYPFLSEGETGLEDVIEDVRSNVADEGRGGRGPSRADHRPGRARRCSRRRPRCGRSSTRGGKALVFGNGGSATDAMDLVADLRAAPQGWPARAAIDLTEDPSILTAIANDIGVEAIFLRQVIAYGQEGDAAIAISTSGNSVT